MALAEQLRACPRLTTLLLQGCDQVGTEGFRVFADRLSQLPMLEDLTLAQLEIRGEALDALATALPELKQLRTLKILRCENLAGCRFEQLANRIVPALETLCMDHSKLGDEALCHLAERFASFPQMKTLSFRGCHDLTPAGFACVGRHLHHLAALEALAFDFTNLVDCSLGTSGVRPPPLSTLKHLRTLSFSGCEQCSTEGIMSLAESLGQMESLEELDLSHTQLQDSSLAKLAGSMHLATRLRKLTLEGTRSFSGIGLRSLAGKRLALEELNLSQTELSSKGLTAFCELLPNFASLRVLSLTSCEGIEAQVLRDFVGELPKLPCLESLSLANTNLDGSGVSMLSRRLQFLTRLRKLDLDQCSRVDTTSLQTLMHYVPSMESLEELYLGGTAVDDECLKILGRLPASAPLRRLDLRGCDELSEKGLQTLESWLQSMSTQRRGITCMNNHQLEVHRVWREVRKCKKCAHEPNKGSSMHGCLACDFFVCEKCMHGALWVPSKLKDTLQGRVFFEAWCAKGHSISGLVWA